MLLNLLPTVAASVAIAVQGVDAYQAARASDANAASLPIRYISHNIRYNATSLFPGEEPWQTRRPRLTRELRFNAQNPPEAFICVQEVLNNQLLDILTDLNQANTTKEWTYIGVGRNDGKTAGEYSPIFYRPAIWQLNSFRTVWLSPTPDVPSFGWDAASIRILTIGTFTHKATGSKLVGMCTHLDDQGTVSRLNSAKIIIDRINNYTGQANYTGKPVLPVVLGGDFNSEMNQEAYLEMSKPYSPVTDLELSVPENQRYGNTNTFTGFTEDTSDDSHIDFLWFGPKNTTFWDIKTYGALANKFDDGVYDSDHRAVIGDMVLSGTKTH